MKDIVNIFDPQRNQNDVHEFLIFILDKLNQEAGKIKKKVDKTTIETPTEEWEEV